MSAPKMEGALEGLRPLDVGDLSRYKRAVEDGEQMGWGYYFPYLLSRCRPDRSMVLIGEERGSLCIYLWRRREGRPRMDLLLAPAPMDVAVLDEGLERANEFNGDFSARVLRVDEKDADSVSRGAGLRVRLRKEQYLYSPQAFTDIGGRRFRTMRRNVDQVRRRSDIEVLPYSSEHLSGCRALLGSWGEQHRSAHGGAGGVGTSSRAIDLIERFSEMNVRGEVVLVDGRLSAYAFGGEIRPGVGCFFDAKSASDVPGLSYFHRWSFLSKLLEFEIVNDGSDVGRSGLGQLKDSLRPVAMHGEYRASQPRSGANA